MYQIFNGDCLAELQNIPDASIDMVLTDPPYSSGGLFAGNRKRDTRTKYCSKEHEGAARFQNFSGDNMDQRSFTAFCREVFAQVRPKVKEGGGSWARLSTGAIFQQWSTPCRWLASSGWASLSGISARAGQRLSASETTVST